MRRPLRTGLRGLWMICFLFVLVTPFGARSQGPGPLEREVFLRGAFNGWQASREARLEFADGKYHVLIRLEAGKHEFKIADAEWREGSNFGASAAGIPLRPEGELVLEGKANALLEAPEAGVYEIVFEPSTPPRVRLVRADAKATADFMARQAESAMASPELLLRKAKGFWVAPDAVVWQPETGSLDADAAVLLASPAGSLSFQGGRATAPVALRLVREGTFSDVRFPHLAGLPRFRIPEMTPTKALELLKGPVAVSLQDTQGRLRALTSLQRAPVIDDIAAYGGSDLGARVSPDGVEFRLWAPTARSVKLKIFADSASAVPEAEVVMAARPRGVWFGKGPSAWNGKFYLYEVSVHVRETGKVETNLVTDPYSFSLSTDSRRSQVVDMGSPALAPEGWKSLSKPPLGAFEDAVIYELHVRDFSASDELVKPEARGKFTAFLSRDSHGSRHLARLSAAGITHVHLLPAFDVASIPEDPANRKNPEIPASGLAPDSEIPQARVEAVKGRDAFNWGYDPFHFFVPEGSYSTNPNGPTRILEFRQMVQALNRAGLRVVMDVVFNHTHAAGQSSSSVLDKVVPDYYHRLNASGDVETSTCCANTATENRMMDKLVVDAVTFWARAYKVDGFRFDLMGHHPLEGMKRVRKALDGLTLAHDGVDGRSLYVYGEGWDFGEVAKNRIFKNAAQLNLAGSNLGSFSDRGRDALRGGTPFSDLREQGVGTGLFVNPSDYQKHDEPAVQRARLTALTEILEAELAGNLKNYELVTSSGKRVRAETLRYNGAPAAYAARPAETVHYVAAHDNETLFDALQAKLPVGTSMADRVRVNTLNLSFVALAQGIPFFHAGDELLRSKSLDRNSFDSGDWFNRLDFSYATNNWAVGLHPRGDNGKNWEVQRALLTNPALRASKEDILAARDGFLDFVKIRRSSPLFRLRTEKEVRARVRFLNVGPERIPAFVAMEISDKKEERLDSRFKRLVVLFNANPRSVRFGLPGWKGGRLALHPVQAAGTDAVVKTVRFDGATGLAEVPALTTAVLTEAW